MVRRFALQHYFAGDAWRWADRASCLGCTGALSVNSKTGHHGSSEAGD
jgi:hypothetical protein